MFVHLISQASLISYKPVFLLWFRPMYAVLRWKWQSSILNKSKPNTN